MSGAAHASERQRTGYPGAQRANHEGSAESGEA